MIAIMLAAAVAALQPADEAAAMSGLYAATVDIDIPGLWSAKRWFAPGHTYRETGTDGDAHGTWTIENGHVCTLQASVPGERVVKYCNLPVGMKVGDKLRDADPVTGNPVFFALEPR